MLVVDSSALIAILRQEAEADAFLKIIVTSGRCVISALNYLETSMVTGSGLSAGAFEELDEFIAEAGMAVAPFDDHQVNLARGAYLRFGKGRHKAGLNLGDCAAYALAVSKSAPLLFKGADFTHTDVMAAILPGGTALEP